MTDKMKAGSLVVALAASAALIAVAPAAQATTHRFPTNHATYLHQTDSWQSARIAYLPAGASLDLTCWYRNRNSSVHGVDVWYLTGYGKANGWVNGWWMRTGHDPNPSVPECT